VIDGINYDLYPRDYVIEMEEDGTELHVDTDGTQRKFDI